MRKAACQWRSHEAWSLLLALPACQLVALIVGSQLGRTAAAQPIDRRQLFRFEHKSNKTTYTCTGSHPTCKAAARSKSQSICARVAVFGCTWGSATSRPTTKAATGTQTAIDFDFASSPLGDCTGAGWACTGTANVVKNGGQTALGFRARSGGSASSGVFVLPAGTKKIKFKLWGKFSSKAASSSFAVFVKKEATGATVCETVPTAPASQAQGGYTLGKKGSTCAVGAAVPQAACAAAVKAVLPAGAPGRNSSMGTYDFDRIPAGCSVQVADCLGPCSPHFNTNPEGIDQHSQYKPVCTRTLGAAQDATCDVSKGGRERVFIFVQSTGSIERIVDVNSIAFLDAAGHALKTPSRSPGAHTNYAMVRAGYECGSADKSLGHYTTVRKCADKCASSSQCRFLKYNGATGDCVHEKADSSQCSKTTVSHHRASNGGTWSKYVGGTDWNAAPGYDFYEFRGCALSGGASASHLQNLHAAAGATTHYTEGFAGDAALIQAESYLGIGQLKANAANLDDICVKLMTKLAKGETVCGKPYVNNTNYVLNCDKKFNAKYYNKTYVATGLLAVLEVCVSTCMDDPGQTCCMVPLPLQPRFPCCRSMGCCPDQNARRRAQSSRAALGPHRAQVSVSVSVTVEETSASMSVYDALLRCLQNPAKLDSMCLTGSSGH